MSRGIKWKDYKAWGRSTHMGMKWFSRAIGEKKKKLLVNQKSKVWNQVSRRLGLCITKHVQTCEQTPPHAFMYVSHVCTPRMYITRSHVRGHICARAYATSYVPGHTPHMRTCMHVIWSFVPAHVVCDVTSTRTHTTQAHLHVYVSRAIIGMCIHTAQAHICVLCYNVCQTQAQLLPEAHEIPQMSLEKGVTRRLNIHSTPFGTVQKFVYREHVGNILLQSKKSQLTEK